MAATTGHDGPAPARGPGRTCRDEAEPLSDMTVGARDELREILITVSPGQFETLARDLKLLREHGAESNTRAIMDAVRERAARVRLVAAHKRKAV